MSVNTPPADPDARPHIPSQRHRHDISGFRVPVYIRHRHTYDPPDHIHEPARTCGPAYRYRFD